MFGLRLSIKGKRAFYKITKRLVLALLGFVLIYVICGFALLYWFVNIDVTAINEKLEQKEEESQILQIRGFARTVHFSRSIADRADFEPCASVCSTSEVEEWPEKPMKFVRYLEQYYRAKSDRALKDPHFNFAILVYYNMGQLFPSQLVQLLDEVDSNENAVFKNPGLAAKILWEVPGFLLRLKENKRRIAERGRFIREYQKILYQCQRGTITPQIAIGVCRQHYDVWRETQ